MIRLRDPQWMTLSDGAEYLSRLTNTEGLTNKDLLRYAESTDLILSLYLPSETIINAANFSRTEQPDLPEELEERRRDRDYTIWRESGTDSVSIFGLWDIFPDYVSKLMYGHGTLVADEKKIVPEAVPKLRTLAENAPLWRYLDLFSIGGDCLTKASVDIERLPVDAFLCVRPHAFSDLLILEDGSVEKRTPEALSTRERNTLYKMILGMAIEKYGYNPEGSRNSATGQNAGSICADLEKAGLPVDAETIKKKLEAAFAATPPEKS